LRISRRKLGLPAVLAQLAFIALVHPFLRWPRPRIAEIKAQNRLNDAPIPRHQVRPVASVNAAETMALIAQVPPKGGCAQRARFIAPKGRSAV
jgi:hypothetical protein